MSRRVRSQSPRRPRSARYINHLPLHGGLVLLAGLLLLAALARAEAPPVFTADTSGVQARDKAATAGAGFIPPTFSRAHVSGNVAGNAKAARDLPAAYDARQDGFVSPVKNQGACGACYTFGTAADLESRLLVAGAGLYDISENNLKECHYQGASCAGGNQYMTISHLSRAGAVLETCDPYVAADVACNGGCEARFHITEWLEISGSTQPDPAVLKQYILDHGPIHTTVFAGDATEPVFTAQFNNYNGSGVLYFTGTNTPNHSVFLVGWDDSMVHAGGTGAWIVKNSWGTGWGGTCGYGSEGGYFYMAYGSASIGKYSSVIQGYMDADTDFSVLSNDEGGFTTAFSGGTTTLWGMSSLTTDVQCFLHRVEFWTTDATTDVDVYVYGSFNGTSASDLLAARYDQSFAEPGYHFVDLTEPLALAAGQTVHLAVKFGNQSYTYPLAADADGPVDAGSSHVSTNGLGWTDLGPYSVDTTIRARVGATATLGVEEDELTDGDMAPQAVDLQLVAAYPNPFNPTTTIEYSLPRRGLVELAVYDLKGARVRSLLSEMKDAGLHQVLWDGRGDDGGLVPSGVYFCLAEQGRHLSALKLVLLK